MFRGRHRYSIDSKGRMAIPPKFREVLAASSDERLIVTNFDQCLWAYPVSEWQALEQKVAALPQFLDEVKALERVFISAAVECPLDGQGRILIPAELRDYAAMQREVMIVGMTKRIELWSVERWDVVFNSSQQRLEALGQKLADLGL